MKQTKLHEKWQAGGHGLNGWCSLPSMVTAEMMSHHDFDSLTIDLQHGLIEYQTALSMLQAITASGITPLARVTWHDPGMIMKLLDAGCLGIICPMVNTPQQAQDFVGAMHYAPAGYRSSGPTRAAMIHGSSYHEQANDMMISLAMIETAEALANVDAICATQNLTGIYIGPSDLSVSLGYKAGLDRTEPEIDKAIGTILAAAKTHGKLAAIHCGSTDYLKSAWARGFELATLASDIRFFNKILSDSMTALSNDR